MWMNGFAGLNGWMIYLTIVCLLYTYKPIHDFKIRRNQKDVFIRSGIHSVYYF